MAEHAKGLATQRDGVDQSPGFLDFLWRNHSELRRELVESQKIRAQIVGFKITFLGTSIGLILAKLDKSQYRLLVIPAFAAIFFDLLIESYSFSIKRIGLYCREHIERYLIEQLTLPKDFIPWEKFLQQGRNKQRLSMIGNLGITILSYVPAVLVLYRPITIRSVCLLVALALLLVYDIYIFAHVGRYVRSG